MLPIRFVKVAPEEKPKHIALSQLAAAARLTCPLPLACVSHNRPPMKAHNVCERGVHLAPWLDEGGRPVLVAVTSKGRACHWARVFSSDNRDEVLAMLYSLLDQEDPIQQIA